MADAGEEGESLLKQIRFLTDLIENAKKGEVRDQDNASTADNSEAERLKQQIEFMTNLIGNAKRENTDTQRVHNSDTARRPGKQWQRRGKTPFCETDRQERYAVPTTTARQERYAVPTTTARQERYAVPTTTARQEQYAVPTTTARQEQYAVPTTTARSRTQASASSESGENYSSFYKAKGRKESPVKFSAKFKWKKKTESDSASTAANQSLNSSSTNPSQKTCSLPVSFNTDRSEKKLSMMGLSRQTKHEGMPTSNTVVLPTPGMPVLSVSSSANLSPASSRSVTSAQSPIKTVARSDMKQSFHQDLNSELLKAQSKISQLKKTMEGNSYSRMSPIKTPLRAAIHRSVVEEKGVLLSKSPFKLERVSPTKNAPIVHNTGMSPLGASIQRSLAEPNWSDNKNKSGLIHSSPVSGASMSNVSPTSAHTNQTGKTVCSKNSVFKKTKYSITRVRPHSDTQNSQDTGKAIWVKKSRYSLQKTAAPSNKVDNSPKLFKLDRRSSGGTSNFSPVSHTQTVARIIKSKYKLQKVQVMPKDAGSRHNIYSGGQVSRNSFRNQEWAGGMKTRHSLYYDSTAKSHFRPMGNGWTAKHVQWTHTRAGRIGLQGNPRFGGQRFAPSSSRQSYGWRNTWRDPRANMEYLVQKRIQSLKKKVKFDPKTRLDHRKDVVKSTTGKKFVMINGILYKSGQNQKRLTKVTSRDKTFSSIKASNSSHVRNLNTRSMKTVTVRGIKFRMDPSGKSLKRVAADSPQGAVKARKPHQVSRVDLGGVTYIQTRPGTLERLGSNTTRSIAIRAVNKSVATAAAKYRKDNTKKLKQKKYCMFYNRFGKCKRQGSCPYIHDLDKIAVCTRFLRGTCKVTDCPFSHKVAKEKMPVCSYFLRGTCSRDDCPYRHVNVSRDAKICSDFLDGYCPLGEKCKKKHTLDCPEFSQTGTCPRGKKCRLLHRQNRKRKLKTGSQSGVAKSKIPKGSERQNQEPEPVAGSSRVEPALAEDTDDPSLPFKSRVLPAYISLLARPQTQESADQPLSADKTAVSKPGPVLKIRPQL